MLVRDLTNTLESIAPLRYAESWDRVGLLVGDPARELKGPALLTIDLTERVIAEAVAHHADAIIAYHPPLWEPLKRLTTGSSRERVLMRAVEAGMSIYSPHTALDSVPGGVTDWLCEGLSGSRTAGKILGDCRALAPFPARESTQEVKIVTFVPEREAETVRGALATAGAGIIGNYTVCSFNTQGFGTYLGNAQSSPKVGTPGTLQTAAELRVEMVCSKLALPLALETLRRFHPYEEPAIDVYELLPKPTRHGGHGRRLVLDHPTPLTEIADRLKQHLGVAHVAIATPSGDHPSKCTPVTHLGVCPGSGHELALPAQADGCQVFVTGEMKHHEVLALLNAGLSVVLAGHTNTERGYLPRLAQLVNQKLPALKTIVSTNDRDPLFTV